MKNVNRHNAQNTGHRRCQQKFPADAIALADAGFTPYEYSILMTARYFFATFAQPDTASWMTVVLSSDDFFPSHHDSPRVVQSVLAVVHEVRISRKSTLRFSSPHCFDCSQVVTAEERHLMSVLRAVKMRRPSIASTHALILCEGNSIDGLLRAAATLMDHFDP